MASEVTFSGLPASVAQWLHHEYLEYVPTYLGPFAQQGDQQPPDNPRTDRKGIRDPRPGDIDWSVSVQVAVGQLCMLKKCNAEYNGLILRQGTEREWGDFAVHDSSRPASKGQCPSSFSDIAW